MRTLPLALAISFLIASSAVAESTAARVAFLSADPPSAEAIGWFDAFTQGLRNHGWEEGRNLVIESRRTPGRFDALDGAAVELVRLKVDVIVTDSTPVARAALKATHTIPIVMALAGDPIGTGLVTSLAHPGGNITGMTLLHSELGSKRLEMLRNLCTSLCKCGLIQTARGDDIRV
jgi:putative ABC transport system substrate-binding protein